MPTIATGDIFYWPSTTGHIGMAYDANTIIHAQMKGNFHKEPNQQDKGRPNLVHVRCGGLANLPTAVVETRSGCGHQES